MRKDIINNISKNIIGITCAPAVGVISPFRLNLTVQTLFGLLSVGIVPIPQRARTLVEISFN